MIRRRIAILAVALAACARPSEPEPTTPTEAAAPAPTPEPAPAPASEAKSSTAAKKPLLPEPNELAVVPPKINAEYEKQSDPKVWQRKFERHGREVHDRKKKIIAALDLEPGMRIADIGVGSGLFALDFARAVGPSGKVYAVDVQQYFLDHVAARAEKAGLENIELVHADQHNPSLPEGSVDLAFMSDVYHHIEYPRTYLGALRNAIVPGGRLVVIDFRRVAGESDAWLVEHVRAEPEEFKKEIESAGFDFVREIPGLRKNFFYVFERP